MVLFWQCLTLMTLGMALVFLFLFVVIQCMRFTAFLIRRYAPEAPAPDEGNVSTEAVSRLAAALAVATDGTAPLISKEL